MIWELATKGLLGGDGALGLRGVYRRKAVSRMEGADQEPALSNLHPLFAQTRVEVGCLHPRDGHSY